MGTTKCLFSRARPGNPTPKKTRGFLSLPAELRNQVYQYYFETDFRCEVIAGSQQLHKPQIKTVKLWAGAFHPNGRTLKHVPKFKESTPLTLRTPRYLGKYTIVQGLQTNWSTSLCALILICKQIHRETIPFLYRKTTFVFNAPNRLNNFLAVVSGPKLESITSLQLHYATYGCPKMWQDRVWQDKHNASWIRACNTASKKLVNLHSLKIWMRVNDDPLRFHLRQSWVQPLLQFRRLLRARKQCKEERGVLEVVDVDFRTRLSGQHFKGNARLARANEDLHRLFGQAVGLAIQGEKEEVAMRGFNEAWNGEHEMWKYHLGFAETGW
jgi:hypothetical protein